LPHDTWQACGGICVSEERVRKFIAATDSNHGFVQAIQSGFGLVLFDRLAHMLRHGFEIAPSAVAMRGVQLGHQRVVQHACGEPEAPIGGAMSKQRYPEEFKTEAVKQVIERGHKVADVSARLGGSLASGAVLAVVATAIAWRIVGNSANACRQLDDQTSHVRQA
jgi:hypothetical protein